MTINKLQKLDEYTATKYVDNSEPDIDAAHLNKTEQALKEAIDKANEVIDTLKSLIATTIQNSTDTVPASSLLYQLNDSITQLNSDLENHFSLPQDGLHTAIQTKNGNTWRRLEIKNSDDIVRFFKSTDGGLTWPVSKTLLTNADISIRTLEQTDVSVAENTYIDVEFDAAKAGYKIIGAVGFTSSESYVAVSRVQTVYSENKIVMTLRNMGTGTKTTIARVQVLYVLE